VLAYLGGHAVHKGYHWLRDILAAVPEENYVLRLVDLEALMGRSAIRAGDWRVRGRVEIVPPYDQAGIDAFFAGIDVLLCPSQAKESFGLTVREAIARGVWVLATDCDGPTEAIVPGSGNRLQAAGPPTGHGRRGLRRRSAWTAQLRGDTPRKPIVASALAPGREATPGAAPKTKQGLATSPCPVVW
jgi:hypothetical protein